MWFNLGASAGDKRGTKGRNMMVARKTQAQVADPQKLAGSWKSK